MSLKGGEINEKKNKQMELHNTKNFCPAKKAINETKRKCTELEKILVNDISNKGLISKISKELI